MKKLFLASLIKFQDIVSIDEEVMGTNSRKNFIHKAIKEERCIGVQDENTIVGFLIYDTHFFECSFISLIVIKASERQKGHASALINYFTGISPTKKIFSSTNQSNKQMQAVFKVNGFIRSGYVENLDEGDPEIIYYKIKE